MSTKVRVEACRLGKGVFAVRRIEPGAVAFTFTGRLIDLQTAIAKGDHEGDVLQVGPELYLDPDSPGRFINHSCSPNAGLKDNTVVVALRRIEPGEEICFDYSTSMNEKRWTMQCQCGSPDCRGIVGDFDTLPAELQQRYIKLGIVSDFNVRLWQETQRPARTGSMRTRVRQRAMAEAE